MAKKKDEEKKSLSRREFLKDTGMVVGGAALTMGALSLAGCASPEAETTTVTAPGTTVTTTKTEAATPWLPSKWDYEADVVVVGLGYAGASAAIIAHDAGADVIVLEKSLADTANVANHWPNSRVCAGFWVNTTDAEEAASFLKAVSGEVVPPDDMCLVWGEAMSHNTEFISSLGGDVVDPPAWARVNLGGWEHPNLPGAAYVQGASVIGGTEGLYQLVCNRSIQDRGITVLWGTPGEKLIQNGVTKEIIGIYAIRDGRTIAIKAKKAVCLACGGYENNAEMLADYNLGRNYHFYGPPGHTGDGIKMAVEVGADLWHMKVASAGAALWHPDLKYGLICMPVCFGSAGAYIMVDKHGHRFSNDHINMHNGWTKVTFFDPEEYEYPRIPCHMIFDESLRAAGPLGLSRSDQPWSADNMAEIEKGWILKGNTIQQIASQIGIDSATLESTIATYNGYCAAGEDPAFDRKPETLVPIETPPFYAATFYPGGPNTQGGPRHNTKCQIVDPRGNPIPRLYAAGELGSLYGIQYPGGGNVGECFAFGRIAGQNAAAETPWE